MKITMEFRVMFPRLAWSGKAIESALHRAALTIPKGQLDFLRHAQECIFMTTVRRLYAERYAIP